MVEPLEAFGKGVVSAVGLSVLRGSDDYPIRKVLYGTEQKEPVKGSKSPEQGGPLG